MSPRQLNAIPTHELVTPGSLKGAVDHALKARGPYASLRAPSGAVLEELADRLMALREPFVAPRVEEEGAKRERRFIDALVEMRSASCEMTSELSRRIQASEELDDETAGRPNGMRESHSCAEAPVSPNPALAAQEAAVWELLNAVFKVHELFPGGPPKGCTTCPTVEETVRAIAGEFKRAVLMANQGSTNIGTLSTGPCPRFVEKVLPMITGSCITEKSARQYIKRTR